MTAQAPPKLDAKTRRKILERTREMLKDFEPQIKALERMTRITAKDLSITIMPVSCSEPETET